LLEGFWEGVLVGLFEGAVGLFDGFEDGFLVDGL